MLAGLAPGGAGCAKKRSADPSPAESTGVPECDAYASRREACSAVASRAASAEARAAAEPGFAAQRSVFRANAGTPEERRVLAEQCAAALAAIAEKCGG